MSTERTMDDPDGYAKAAEYWSEIAPTVEGMLGGLGKLSPVDLALSNQVLQKFILDEKSGLKCDRVLEVGAGIGRITKHLLSKYFSRITLLEADKKFLDAAPRYLGQNIIDKVDELICMKLQDFHPKAAAYDCVWCQWVLGYLRDDDLVEALRRLKNSLRMDSNPLIFVKENVAKGDGVFDDLDSSVTRSRDDFQKIFTQADLTIVEEHLQTKFPSALYPVRLFVLK